ncbi:hypothetical protein ABZ470_02800 [Streptosporangium sp. NPDC020072]|uniref:Uncharacterized protein n=1 Tax=Streptosporangium jomthongense TaxID=1193683 RepID=A0ABV8ESL1_9ACTN
MRFRLLRVAVPTAVVALTLATTSGVAHAATSHQVVYHADGNWAGEVWFNAGTHNMAKGRNSFTVKDTFCGDGWKVGVHYEIPALNIYRTFMLNGDCSGESSFSVVSYDVAPSAIHWWGLKTSTTENLTTYESQVNDYVD